MFEFGRMNRLVVSRIDEEGAWLRSGRQEALLPKKELDEDVSVGAELLVFVYADAKGNPVATLRHKGEPAIGNEGALVKKEDRTPRH